MTSFTKDF